MSMKIEITGKDVQELYVNGVNTLLLLTRGGQEMFKPVPQAPAEPPPSVDAGAQVNAPVEPPVEAPVVEPEILPPPPKTRTRKPKPEPAVIDAAFDVTPPAKEESGIPDFLQRETDAPKEQTKAEPLTLDDMRQRVKDIVAAHAARSKPMPECVAYVRQLFEPFGIKLAADLTPEQYAEFWKVSQGYLDGTTK